MNFGFCQPTSPGSIEIKTIPDTIYEGDFVRFEVFAQFISGSGIGYCYIKTYSIDKINDTIFLNIHYYNSKDQFMCETKDTIAFDSLLVKGKYQLNFKGTATDGWNANLDTFYFEVLGGVRGVKDGELLSNIELTQIETGLFQIKNEYGNNLNLKVYNVLGEILSEERIEIGINKIR